MSIINKYIGLLRKLMKKIRFRMKLRQMDYWWYFIGGNSWQLFSPSFYYIYTEEEIKRITSEELDKLRAIRDRFIAEHNLMPQEQQQKEAE